MTIFIIWFTNFHSEREFFAAFSTRENAEARKAQFGREAAQMEIEEYELDA